MGNLMVGLYAPNGRMGIALQLLLNEKSIQHLIYDKKNIGSFLNKSNVIIDFSTASATLDLLKYIHTNNVKCPLVIGTTGLNKETTDLLEIISKTNAVFYAPNFSLGVFVQKKVTEMVAKLLDYDAEIFEVHHRYKKDAPSGTALSLGESVAKGRGQNLNDFKTDYQKQGHELRQPGQIGFSVARGGSVTGEHSVHFYGDFEEISITHRGYNRSLYAAGSIKAVQWIQNKMPGLYGMDDLF